MLLAQTLAGPVYVFDRPLRMLVVDDDPIMLEFAISQLAMPGGTIVTALNGEEAWELLETSTEPFDIILSDLEMPKLNGFGLLGLIRESDRHRHLPVVVVTSREDMFAIDRAYEIGATSFAVKPVNWRLLGYQLRYVMRASRMEAETRAARDEAERVADLKRSLLALLQHETRTPLHSIVGYAELLQNVLTEPGAARDYAERVLGAARSLSEILRRISYFSQLSTGTLALEQELMPLVHVVEEVLAPLRGRAVAQGLTLALVDEAGPVMVACDLKHLTIALREVVENALAHAPAGSAVTVTLRCEGAGVVLAVADRGAGLAPDALRRSQEAFAQNSNPLTRSMEGLGLGLPTAQRIVELHGGALTVASVPGEGTTVTIGLPSAPSPRLTLAG